MRIRTGLAALALLLALAVASPARAATVSVQSAYIDGYKGSGDYATTVTVLAAPGERNDITVSSGIGAVAIRDAATPLTAGAGCAVTNGTATCPILQRYWTPSVVVHAGDGDDALHTDFGSARLYGDDGNDVLTGEGQLFGGPGDDTLTGDGSFDGGPGDDVMTGGPWTNDRVLYSDRTAPVSVRLGTASGNGEAGESDAITGIEDLEGGSGNDVLVGDDGPNHIAGHDGDDRIEGLGGDDLLDGDADGFDLYGTADTVLGGDGADTMTTGPGGLADGGAGADVIRALGAAHVVGGPGRDRVDAANAGLSVDLADGEPDDLTCNPHGPSGILTLDALDAARECPLAQIRGPRPAVVAISAVARHGTLHRGVVVRVRLACPATARGACRVRTALFATPGDAAAARATGPIAPGTSATHVLRLPAATARRLARHHVPTATVAVSMRDARGVVRTQYRWVHLPR